MAGSTTITEENYLKAIYNLSLASTGNISTTTLSAEMKTTPASVTDMVKKLSEKSLVDYVPYRGVVLTDEGLKIALNIVRMQRLWEVFLVEKLKFSWDEVHETAELLEHIRHQKLIDKLDEFLGYPRFDPHGDPIPDADGNILPHNAIPLNQLELKHSGTIAGVLLHTPEFLQYLNRIGLKMGSRVTVLETMTYNNSRLLQVENSEVIVGADVGQNILVIVDCA